MSYRKLVHLEQRLYIRGHSVLTRHARVESLGLARWFTRCACLLLVIFIAELLTISSAAAQQELLGLESRAGQVIAYGIQVKDLKTTVTRFGEIPRTERDTGYLVGTYGQDGGSTLMKVSRVSSRVIEFSATLSSGARVASTVQLSVDLGMSLVVLGGFKLPQDRVKDVALVDISSAPYRWFVISNPLTSAAREVRTFTLGSEGEIPDWFLGKGRSIRFAAVRHQSDSDTVRLRSSNESGRAIRSITGRWSRKFGAVTTSQMRLGYRRDWGLALQAVTGGEVFVLRDGSQLVRSKTSTRRCAGVQHLTRVLRRGDSTSIESCPDRRFIVSRRGASDSAAEGSVLEVGNLGAVLYFMRRGDRTSVGPVNAELPGVDGVPTPPVGEVVEPTPTPTPTVTPTPTPTPMNTDVLFEQVRYSTFEGENDVAVADFNGDGFLDLASAAGAGRVDILLGNGDGTFTAGVPFSAARANYLDAGDLNGDLRVDLIVANYITGGLFVYLGNGDGTFAASGVVATSAAAQGIELGDFNRDGRLDAATLLTENDQLAIFLGNGNGSFSPWQTLTTGGIPFNLKLGDLNGDGYLDIVTGDSADSTLSVFINQGTGTFNSRTTLPGGPSTEIAAIGDINGDGRLDLIAVNQNAARFGLYLGRGNGTFDPPNYIATSPAPFGAAVADFNVDGWLDVAVTALSGSLNIFLGNGNGTFQIRRTYPSTGGPRYIGRGDFNRDGRPDLAVSQYSAGTMAVYLARP